MKHFAHFALLASIAVLGCSPDDGGASDVAKGEVALKARDLQAAEKCFAAAAAKDATNSVSQVRLAVVRMQLGDPAGAASAVAAARACDPDSAEALFAEGQVAYLKKDYALARKDFAQVAAARNLPAELRANALAAGAVVDVLENRLDAARIALWRALRTDPKCAAAWYHLAYLSRVTYDFVEAALMQYEMASRLLPASDERVAEITRKILPSIRDTEAQRKTAMVGVSKRDPAASAKLVAEAHALQAKDVKKAAAKFLEAWEKDVLSFEAASGWARLASASSSAANPDRVLEAFNAALDARPNNQALYLAAAQYALKVGKSICAQRLLDQALAHDPSSKKALTLYLDVLKRNGKTKEAALYQAYLKEL
ncbi:MAG: tetratricopeptide repeat protein [Kiritimatiellae bacterium]|nr:tetratricopeptide repeat protein [Kiritimatiellia bacterium]